jgi:hypothetical protein
MHSEWCGTVCTDINKQIYQPKSLLQQKLAGSTPCLSSTKESINREETRTSASAARGRAKRTFSAVVGAALPGEEAEGTLPRVLELAVRHPRLASPPLLTCTTQKSSSDPPQNQQERLSSQHRGDEMVATDGCGKSRRKGRECWIDPNGRLTEWDQVSSPVRSRVLIGASTD